MEYSALLFLGALHAVPLLLWLYYYVSRDKAHPEQFVYIAITLLSGACAAAIIPFLQWYVPGLIGVFLGQPQLLQSTFVTTLPPLMFVILSAGLEEVLKHLAAIQIMFRVPSARDEMSDGLLYPVTAALGFSLVENILYTLYVVGTGDVMAIIVRGTITMFAHTAFSAVFGCIFVSMRQKIPAEAPRTLAPRAFQYVRRFWRREAFVVVSSVDIVLEGLVAATLLHTVYNLLLEGSGSQFGVLSIVGYILLLFVLTTIAYVQSAKNSMRQ